MQTLEIDQDKVYRQAVVRLGIWVIASLYVGIGLYRGVYEYGPATFMAFCAIFAGFTLIPMLGIRRWPYLYLWVYAGLCVDLSANALVMLLTGCANSPFFLVYLWILVGYITRYGPGMVIPASALSLASFTAVVLISGDWQRIPLEISLQYLALALLPGYLQSLVSAVMTARAEADEANRAKSRFLANMSHEIRTPLAGLVGTTDLLRLTPLNDEQQRYVANLKSSAHTLRALVDDILDFSKIEAGKLTLDEHNFSLKRVIDEVEAVMAPLAVKKGLRLRSEFAPGLPRRVLGDPVRLSQILFNLVGNAIKFTEQGEVVVRVLAPVAAPIPESAESAESARSLIRIEVEDTGIGIPADQLTRVFQSFTQVQGSEEAGGTGLGTTISRELVRLMGGRIGVRSTPGAGSTFWFEIPWRLPEDPNVSDSTVSRLLRAEIQSSRPPAAAPLPVVTDNAPSQSPAKGRILVADDDLINAEVIATLLRKGGYQVEVVMDGAEALQALERGGIDLAFIDGRMPKLSGLQVAERWRKQDPAFPPLVALTANTSPTDEQRYRAAGFDEFLSKPLTPDRLFEVTGLSVRPNADS